MFGLDMLDVAAGVIVVYLFLSLAASAIAEMIESALKYRAKDLEKGIAELLQQDGTLVKRFYEHPLIAALYQGNYTTGASHLPSYIPARTFALAFIDLAERVPKGVQPDAAKRIKEVVAKFKEDADAARQRAEDWFNGAMDRVSGWYKHRTHVRMLIIGAVMAIVLNVDSIYLTRHITTDKKVREALVGAATKVATDDALLSDGDPAKQRLQKQIDQLESFGLPIGWGRVKTWPWAGENHPVDWRATWNAIWSWVLRIVGWALTALAISLGAPFWFDTLNKIMVIRSTVKPSEKSKEEASEDRQIKQKITYSS